MVWLYVHCHGCLPVSVRVRRPLHSITVDRSEQFFFFVFYILCFNFIFQSWGADWVRRVACCRCAQRLQSDFRIARADEVHQLFAVFADERLLVVAGNIVPFDSVIVEVVQDGQAGLSLLSNFTGKEAFLISWITWLRRVTKRNSHHLRGCRAAGGHHRQCETSHQEHAGRWGGSWPQNRPRTIRWQWRAADQRGCIRRSRICDRWSRRTWLHLRGLEKLGLKMFSTKRCVKDPYSEPSAAWRIRFPAESPWRRHPCSGDGRCYGRRASRLPSPWWVRAASWRSSCECCPEDQSTRRAWHLQQQQCELHNSVLNNGR